MKIALLTDGIYPYVIGGMQKHSYYLAKYLAMNGIFVDLYHTNKSNYDISELSFFSDEEKKFIRSFVVEFPSLKKIPGHYIRASYQYSVALFKLFRANSEDADFIYAKGFAGWKLLEEKSRGYSCAPVGVNFHGYEMFQPAPGFKAWLEQRLLLRSPVLRNINKADYLFSYGGKITEILEKLSDRSRIIELPTGIEPAWLRTVPAAIHSPVRFVFVGRYERRKGILELNEAIHLLSKNHAFEFDFIGPIPEEKKLRIPGLRYHGSLSEVSRIREILLDADVLVCPSHSEGMPNVILEGMACGLAVIATDVGAVSGLVSSENGALIEPGNVKALENAMSAMISLDQAELLRLKAASLEKSRTEFLWENIIRRTIKAITRVLPG